MIKKRTLLKISIPLLSILLLAFFFLGSPNEFVSIVSTSENQKQIATPGSFRKLPYSRFSTIEDSPFTPMAIKSTLVEQGKFTKLVKHVDPKRIEQVLIILPLITKSPDATSMTMPKWREPDQELRAEEGYQLDIPLSSFDPHPDSQKSIKYTKGGKIDESRKFFKEEASNGHLDARFASSSEEGSPLRELFKHWSIWADANEYPYWIAHGTLLGWVWNERILAWDNDIDLQVPANLLWKMHEKHSNTLIDGRFLFEVNSNYKNRLFDQENVIDARFIDTVTGAFIDITGLATLTARKFKMVDQSIPNQALLTCKSPHHYQYSSIFPLMRIYFEGIPTWRPNNVESILDEEYKANARNNPVYRNYRFDTLLGDWILIEDCEELHKIYIAPLIEDKMARSQYPRFEWFSDVVLKNRETGESLEDLMTIKYCALSMKLFRRKRRDVIYGKWENNTVNRRIDPHQDFTNEGNNRRVNLKMSRPR